MSSKFECHYRQIFGGGLGQLSKYPLLEAVGIQMSSKFKCHYRQIFCGWGHTTTNIGNLTQRLRCFALRIKMLRCRRPLRDFSSCFHAIYRVTSQNGKKPPIDLDLGCFVIL